MEKAHRVIPHVVAIATGHRYWRIDPTKHFQSEVHNLMVLIERANETNDNTMPDKNILAILDEEISKDPREALRITALNCHLFHSPFLLIPLNYALLIESALLDRFSIV